MTEIIIYNVKRYACKVISPAYRLLVLMAVMYRSSSLSEPLEGSALGAFWSFGEYFGFYSYYLNCTVTRICYHEIVDNMLHNLSAECPGSLSILKTFSKIIGVVVLKVDKSWQ